MMRRTIAGTAGTVLIAAIAIAAGEVPARYVGPFPSFGQFTSVTATFTGSRLILNATFVAGGRFLPRTGQFTCNQTSPAETRCLGQFVGGKTTGDAGVLTVTWKGGVPVAATFVK
jgi:hypothetical protein